MESVSNKHGICPWCPTVSLFLILGNFPPRMSYSPNEGQHNDHKQIHNENAVCEAMSLHTLHRVITKVAAYTNS